MRNLSPMLSVFYFTPNFLTGTMWSINMSFGILAQRCDSVVTCHRVALSRAWCQVSSKITCMHLSSALRSTNLKWKSPIQMRCWKDYYKGDYVPAPFNFCHYTAARFYSRMHQRKKCCFELTLGDILPEVNTLTFPFFAVFNQQTYFTLYPAHSAMHV